MKYLLLVLLLLSGCGIQSEYKITCDSGFDTGWYDYTGMSDGVLIYGNRHNLRIHRKMLSGEICTMHRKAK